MFANEAKIDVNTALEVHDKCKIISTSKWIKTKEHKMKTGILNTFKIKIKKRAKTCQNIGIISTMAKMKRKNCGDHKQVYVKYGGNECIFLLDNTMVSLIKVKIEFGPFWVLLDNINAKNIVKFEIGTCQKLLFLFL